jgi:hypothetical protein
MGLNAWADKLDFGPGTAKRSEKRKQLGVEWAVNNAKTKEAFAASNKEAKEAFAGIKADFVAETKASIAGLAAIKAARIGTFEGVTLNTDSISYKRQGGSIAGATARVETAADARRRITATRLLAIGVFALAVKKQTGNVFLTVEHPDYGFVVEIPMKLEAKARAFAAKINSAARHAAPSTLIAPMADAAPADVADQLRKLGELHAAGILTDAEFTAKKTELLDRL